MSTAPKTPPHWLTRATGAFAVAVGVWICSQGNLIGVVLIGSGAQFILRP